jgi:Tol biopolymer transport system component
MFCPCLTNVDCPTGESCQGGICLPESTSDVEEADMVEDTGQEVMEDPDITQDPAPEDEDLTIDTGVGDADTTTDMILDLVADAVSDTEDTGPDLGLPDEEPVEDLPPVEDMGTLDDYNPWIAFESALGTGSVQFIRTDGTGLTDYESDSIIENSPSWSPDGTKMSLNILDLSGPGGGPVTTLQIVDFTAGSVSTYYIGTLNAYDAAAWSSDSSSVVIAAGADANQRSLYHFNLTTEEYTELTSVSGDDTDGTPVWDPLDNAIYYGHRTGDFLGGSWDIMHVNIDSSEVSSVTSGVNIQGKFDVSPDGNTLVYPTFIGASIEHTLIRMDLTSGAEEICCSSGDREPSFFRDGSLMAAIRPILNPSGATETEVIVINAHTGALINEITADAVSNSKPVVSPIDSSDVDITNY